MQAELVRFDHAASAEAFFRWRQVGSDAWQTTSVRTVSGSGPLSETLDGLRYLQHYEVQAAARVDGQEIAGSIRSLIPSDMYALAVDDHHIRVPHHAALNPGSDSFTIEAWVGSDPILAHGQNA